MDFITDILVVSFRSSIVYIEGNLETKVFNDPVTGLFRRIREIALRRNGK